MDSLILMKHQLLNSLPSAMTSLMFYVFILNSLLCNKVMVD